MKRGLLPWVALLLMAAMLAKFAAAEGEITATAVTSTGEYNDKIFSCTGSTVFDDQLINKAELFHDATGTMEVNKTNTTFTAGKSITATFYVTNIPTGTFNWKCRVFLQNESNATSSQLSFTSNSAPLFNGPLPNVTIAEDTSNSSAFDLDNFFSDVQTLTYTYTGDSYIPTYVTVTIGSGNVVSISGTGNWSGVATVYFTATDSGSLTNRSNTVSINVTPVNDAPYLKQPIPSQNWSINTNKTIDLSSYFADVETSAGSLNYSVYTAPSYINVTISGSTATLVPEAGWSSSSTVVFRANDSLLSVNSNSVELNVDGNATENETENSAPVISGRRPILPTVTMEVGDEQEFSITKSDPNGDTLTVEWYLDGNKISDASADSYNYEAESNGTYKLKVSVSDGDLSTTYMWTINVVAAGSLRQPSTVGEGSQSQFNVTPTYAPSAVCGDGRVDEGENCLTCEADAGCAETEVCDEGVCRTKSTAWKIVALAAVILALLGGIGYFAYYFVSRGKLLREKPMARKEAERKLGSGIDIAPASEFSDFLEKKEQQLKGSYKKEGKKAPAEPAPDPTLMLKGYVKNMRAAAHSDLEIRQNLKAKGWKDAQVDEALR